MKKKIELAIYGYDKAEFMPIYYDGELANKTDFVAYKLNRIAQRLKSLREQ